MEMCNFGKSIGKHNYICIPCRKSKKVGMFGMGSKCPKCGEEMISLGYNYGDTKIPNKTDNKGWEKLGRLFWAKSAVDSLENIREHKRCRIRNEKFKKKFKVKLGIKTKSGLKRYLESKNL